MADRELDEAVVAVVGASGALGSRVARLLAERGALVVPVGRSRERLAALGLDEEPVELDVTDASAGERLAERPMAGMVAYSASKAAAASFTQALQLEWRRAGVSVIDVRPPHTETGLVDRALAGQAPRLPQGLEPDAVAERVVRAIVAGERRVASEDF